MSHDPQSSTPHLVHSHDVQLDVDYTQWLVELKNRYRSAQIKAAVKVNAEKLLFNWQLGRDLVVKRAEERWGAGVVEQVSLDLKEAFPQERGFSTTNLWDMKKWYLFYTEESQLRKLHQLGGELQAIELQNPGKLHQLGGEISSALTSTILMRNLHLKVLMHLWLLLPIMASAYPMSFHQKNLFVSGSAS